MGSRNRGSKLPFPNRFAPLAELGDLEAINGMDRLPSSSFPPRVLDVRVDHISHSRPKAFSAVQPSPTFPYTFPQPSSTKMSHLV
jgi:hypothetical protein